MNFPYFHGSPEHNEWLRTDRTHEECAECDHQYSLPALCKGHAAGENACPVFSDCITKQLTEVEKKYTLAMKALQHSCDDETEVREIVRTVLPHVDVDGSSYGVPCLLDLVDMLVKEIERYRKQ